MESLGREEVSLRGFAREEGEKQNEYAARKLEALRACLTGEDLLILDNLDEEDDFLEEVLSLPCHIVITSRQDFRDWNYPQMEIYELNGEEEVMELFRAYNAVSYEEEEMEAVRDMLQYMDYHTMLTELLAKHLRVSGLSPREVKKRMEGDLGIIGLSREEVRHRKGRRSGFWRICLSLPERGWTGRCFWNGGEATPATRRIWNGLCCGDGWRSGRTKKFPSTRSCWIWFMGRVTGGRRRITEI